MLWAETLSSVEEIEAALAGAATTGLPVICTLSFDTHGSTMMGLTPARFAAMCGELDVSPHAFGANCGLGPAETVIGIVNLGKAAADTDVLVAKGNCGIPQYVDGVVEYGGTPALMGRYARLARDAGARIIGGCCGTTPEHVRAMRDALEGYEPDTRQSGHTRRGGRGTRRSHRRRARDARGPPRRQHGRRRCRSAAPAASAVALPAAQRPS